MTSSNTADRMMKACIVLIDVSWAIDGSLSSICPKMVTNRSHPMMGVTI
jgi:hypothetical protein